MAQAYPGIRLFIGSMPLTHSRKERIGIVKDVFRSVHLEPDATRVIGWSVRHCATIFTQILRSLYTFFTGPL